MSIQPSPTAGAAGGTDLESAKRRQILEGARREFLTHGYEAASMEGIARAAKVSKGTLYVYFDSKEALFSTLIQQAKQEAAEGELELDAAQEDVAAVLNAFAVRLMSKLVARDHLSLVRMVVGASERFPSFARSFFDAGPGRGAARLAAYIEAQRQRGALRVADPQIAAWQFLGMCSQPTLIVTLLQADGPPDASRIQTLADAAVATFMAAHGPSPERR